METFCLPYHEIMEKFTKSELILMAWRSNEQSYQWKKRMKKAEQGEDIDDRSSVKGKTKGKRKLFSDSIGPERMPDRFFTQETMRDKQGKLIAEPGDFNLALVPGEDARRYFESVLKIPMPPGVSKIAAEDETTQQIRNAYGIRR